MENLHLLVSSLFSSAVINLPIDVGDAVKMLVGTLITLVTLIAETIE